MNRVILVVILIVKSFISLYAQWQNDSLKNYEMRYVIHNNDYSGMVKSTIIRHTTNNNNNYGILYIHGYNDYFYQWEMGDKFTNAGYNFYATDLRKYGRSILPTQRLFEARSYSEYFADLDSAISEMNKNGITRVILLGHSNGGLIATLYAKNNRNKGIIGLILNSPFFEWNFNWLMRNIAIPIVSFWGEHIHPDFTIPQGDNNAYGQSLHKDFYGEWDFNTSWKLLTPPPVTAGWINAVSNAQQEIIQGTKISIPILLMRSDKSIYDNQWSQSYMSGDAILNVNDISSKGHIIGEQITEVVFIDGIHDLVLSRKKIRNTVYNYMINWCNKITL